MRICCRRCQADLDLVVRARRRLAYLVAQRDGALADGDEKRAAALAAELRWLAPTSRLN
jgi:hypothetical protein